MSSPLRLPPGAATTHTRQTRAARSCGRGFLTAKRSRGAVPWPPPRSRPDGSQLLRPNCVHQIVVTRYRRMSLIFSADNDPPAGPFVALTAYNRGRTAVAVSSVGVVAVKRPWSRRGRVLMAHPTSTGPVMPHTLEPGHSANWMLDQKKLVAGKKNGERFRGYAALATKKTSYTLRTLSLP
jgi:hypothetical protein